MIKYGFDITYTDFWGYKTTCGCESFISMDEAKKVTIDLARMDGWTNPKWWQWWRWNDTRVENDRT